MSREIGPINKRKDNRKIIGISLPAELASKVKAEIDRRQIRLNELFKEMWALYEKYGGAKKKT